MFLTRVFLAFAVLTLPAFAQETDEEIVVIGQPLREQVRSFVAEAAQEMRSEDQMARWERRVCPSLIGLRNREQAQFVIDRITQRAFSVGLDVGAPECRTNVLIFVTSEAEALARVIADEYHDLVGYYANQTAVTQGREALAAFVDTPRPVRWWHVSQTVSADGQVLGDTLARPARSGGFRNVQVVQAYSVGRLRSMTRQDFSRVIIIVDADDAQGVQLSALGDYLAMVALAQIAPDADMAAAPSILDLFAEGGGPTALTDWDIAYLEGLYGALRAAPNSQTQRRDIVRRMEDRLRE